MASRAALGRLALLIAGVTTSAQACTCSKANETAPDATAADPTGSSAPAPRPGGEPGGLSAPIAGTRGEQGEVVVAGLDVPAGAIRVQRISGKDEVLADRTVLPGVAWSGESELKLVPAGAGVAVMWRGLRAGKLVRQTLVLGADLAPKGEPIEVTAASCTTHDGVWYTDGKRAHSRAWGGDSGASSATRTELPKDKDASLVCGAHHAFALLEEDDGTSLVVLGGAAADAGSDAGSAHPPVLQLLKESDFGEDEQRERAEYTVGDDLGVVRLGTSGAVTLREVRGGVRGPLRKLTTTIPRDDDVVAVDASPRAIVVVFTEDVGEACKAEAGAGTSPSTRVRALRIDRSTFEESVVDLSPGSCGREVGPFFTAALGDAVSVAWVERIPVAGKSRAPIAGLAHRAVPAAGPLPELGRVEQPADALVDAACDGTRCYAVALARRAGMDAMVPGLARVIRY